MKCTSCGADLAGDQLKCPYCGTVNEQALKLAKEVQTYDAAYEKKRGELLESGESQVLKHLVVRLGIVFLVIVILSLACFLVLDYRFSRNSKYQVTGARLVKNRELIGRYLEEKEYLRAYSLASTTDPTQEHFQYYPEYAAELSDIYTYSLVLIEALQSMDEMDEGDNYAALTDSVVTCANIFYTSGNGSQIKDDLTREVDALLKNYYRLTDEEIESLKAMEPGKQFTLEGSADVERITKERMEAYFGK